MNRYQTVSGLVINKQKQRERDLVVTLLTPNLGKIKATAKNTLSLKSSRLSSLQLGNIIKAHLYQKNNSFWLSEATTISSFLLESKNLAQLSLLFYFLELLNRLIRENQLIDLVYDISINTISAIKKNQINNFLNHEIAFINTLGFGTPDDAVLALQSKQYPQCQKIIQRHLESILEYPLESPKLFR